MSELPKSYNPRDAEEKWYPFWEKNGLFHAKANPSRKPYTVVIPPPNITGILTMGHVLNNTIQDVFVRWKRMQGYETLWMPGTDHAGIATQNVVEKSLAKEEKTRHDLGREQFLKRVWQWKEQYGGTIIKQLKKLGTSCDWERERFTMDEGLSKAVQEIFIHLHGKGLIYRGKYIINWCPKDHTAISDDEVNTVEHHAHLYYLKYPIKGSGEFAIVATTRPETMLGDVAVAVHPDDDRHKHLIGKTAILPLVGRELPVIADNFVDPAFGTGMVKITPAHDSNDYWVGQRHNLPQINIFDISAAINENAPAKYRGMDRSDARKAVMQDLETQGLVVKVEPHTLSLGHCYRCETIIEPYLSDQWFVKMKPLAGPALDVVLDGTIKFHPERWVKTYEHWMNNIHDWCISRQLWWGHRIPVWYCIGEENCKLECKNPIVSTTKPERCPHCGSSRLRQDEDVLDTWFSSWLWPFSTLGWPRDNPDLRYFYPTDTLVTAPDIIFFWVARMIMAGLEVSGEIPLPDGSTRSRAELRVPFRDVYFTSIIRDMKGRKMSKSLGNSPDPLDVIAEYGADALRFTIIYLAPLGQDVLYSNEKCEIGRNFANKIWNAGRFLLMNKEQLNAENPGQGVDRETLEAPGGNRSEGAASGKSMPATKQAAGQTQSVIRDGKSDMPSVTAEKSTLNDGFLDLADRWILSRLHSTISDLDDALAKFEINQATKILYDFVWHDFCDWYVEMIKGRLYGDESAHVKQVVLDRALDVFDQSLRLLHPFMPFVSEELWQHLADRKSGESIMVAQYPSVDTSCIDKETEAEMAFVQNIINSVRNIRGELSVPPSKEINLIINFADNTKEDILKKYRGYFQRLARVTEIQTLRDGEKPRNAASAVVDGGEVFIPLEGLIDLAAERERIRKEVTRLQGMVDSTQKKLANESFVSRAPGDVVDKEREKLETFRANLVKLQKNLERL